MDRNPGVCLLAASSLSVLLAGCAAPQPPAATAPVGSAALEVNGDDGFRYVITRQALDQALGGVMLRVSRAGPPDMSYSDGLVAKTMAEAYCSSLGQSLNPGAFGTFSIPASWVFEGGCQ